MCQLKGKLELIKGNIEAKEHRAEAPNEALLVYNDGEKCLFFYLHKNKYVYEFIFHEVCNYVLQSRQMMKVGTTMI